MKLKREEKIKMLVFSLCSFAAIFIGVICGFSLNNLKNDSRKLPDELNKKTNILLVFLDENKKEADAVFGVMLDPKSKEIVLEDIPRSLKTEYDGEEKTVREVYAENGAEALSECVSKEKNTEFDKYICLDKDLLEKTANTIGDITVNFSAGVSFSENGESFAFESGENTLNPKEFSRCFAYLCKGGKAGGSRAEMLKCAVSRLAGVRFAPWQQKEFLNVVKDSKTDIASYDFDDLAKVFSAMDNAETTVKK